MKYIDVARICHQANKAYCESQGDQSQVDFDIAPEWQKESATTGVKAHVESNFTLTPEESHNAWMREKVGWIYGETKDAEKKIHPCMVIYSKLPDFQKKKDALFTAIVHALLKEAP